MRDTRAAVVGEVQGRQAASPLVASLPLMGMGSMAYWGVLGGQLQGIGVVALLMSPCILLT